MSQEVFEIVQGMNPKSIELQLTMQCAPLIAGLKVSNLLIVSDHDEKKVRKILSRSGIACYRLVKTEHKATYLLFRRHMLENYLMGKDVQEFLMAEGYRLFEFGHLLRVFQQRYKAYIDAGEAFPHEMGLFLGYPVEDVDGFTKNNGENFLCSGYWKVYKDAEEKQKLFEAYEVARARLLRWLSKGISLEAVFSYYNDNQPLMAAI